MLEIKGEHRPLEKVFSNDYVLNIPHYQRPYAWKPENAQELVTDLVTFMGDAARKVDEIPPYFLGSIVLVKNEALPEADVIDGQQRLTTLTMLLSALRAATRAPFSDGLTAFLYQVGNPVTGAPDQYRLRLRPDDAEFFRQYVQAPDGLEKLATLTRELPDAQRLIRDNALLLLREVTKLGDDKRQCLAQYLIRRCYLVVVSTPDTDSAYRIFSILNDRGLDLSHADILKAELVSKIQNKDLQRAYA